MNLSSKPAQLEQEAYKQIKVVGITSPGIEEILLSNGRLINRSDLKQ